MPWVLDLGSESKAPPHRHPHLVTFISLSTSLQLLPFVGSECVGSWATCLSTALSYSFLAETPCGRDCYQLPNQEEENTQRSEVICPKPHSRAGRD